MEERSFRTFVTRNRVPVAAGAIVLALIAVLVVRAATSSGSTPAPATTQISATTARDRVVAAIDDMLPADIPIGQGRVLLDDDGNQVPIDAVKVRIESNQVTVLGQNVTGLLVDASPPAHVPTSEPNVSIPIEPFKIVVADQGPMTIPPTILRVEGAFVEDRQLHLQVRHRGKLLTLANVDAMALAAQQPLITQLP